MNSLRLMVFRMSMTRIRSMLVPGPMEPTVMRSRAPRDSDTNLPARKGVVAKLRDRLVAGVHRLFAKGVVCWIVGLAAGTAGWCQAQDDASVSSPVMKAIVLDESAGVISIPVPFGVEWKPQGLWVTSITNQCIYRFQLDDTNAKWKTGDFPSRWSVCGGSGFQGYSGDGGDAQRAEMNWPHEVRFGPGGELFIADTRNHVIRMIDRQGENIRTLAGNGEPGFVDSKEGGKNATTIENSNTGSVEQGGKPAETQGSSAKFDQPHSVVLLNESNLLVADTKNHRIRQINIDTGKVTTFCGDGQRRLPQEGQARIDASLFGPRSLAVDDQSIWIALREGNSIWRLDRETDTLHRIAGTGKKGYSGDGGSAKAATLRGPKGLAIDGQGRVLIVDTENHCVRRVDVQRDRIETVLGGSKTSQTTALKRPHGIAAEPKGSAFWVADSENDRLIRWSPDE